MVYSVFLYPTNNGFDVEPIKRHLMAMPGVFLDPLGTTTYVVCGVVSDVTKSAPAPLIDLLRTARRVLRGAGARGASHAGT